MPKDICYSTRLLQLNGSRFIRGHTIIIWQCFVWNFCRRRRSDDGVYFTRLTYISKDMCYSTRFLLHLTSCSLISGTQVLILFKTIYVYTNTCVSEGKLQETAI